MNYKTILNPKRVCLTFCLLFTFYSQSQNVSSYSLSFPTGTYTALTGTTSSSLTATADDELSTAISMPFTFNFGGNDYSQFVVSSNGWLSFASPANSYPTNTIDNAMLAKPLIMPLWDDLQCRNTPSYVVTGTTPNRIMKIEWNQVEWGKAANNDVISFQVWLYETTHVIDFRYKQGGTAVSSASATIGLYDLNSTMSILDGSGTSPTAKICYSDFKVNVNSKPANNTIYRFTPPTYDDTKWWVHVYDNGSSGVADVDNENRYVGYYTFRTTDFTGNGEGFKTNLTNTTGYHGWAPNGTPSSATGYVGCPTSTQNSTNVEDRFKYHFRRYGLPCGFYKVRMRMLDDRAKLSINKIARWDSDPTSAGTVPYGYTACSAGCDIPIGFLYLDQNSSVELKVQENTGFTGAWMEIEKINDIVFYQDEIDNTNQPLCLGSSILTMTGQNASVSSSSTTGTLLNPSDIPWKYTWEKSVDGLTNWVIVAGETGPSLSPGITNISMNYRRNTILCGAIVETSEVAVIAYDGIGNELGQNGNSKTCRVDVDEWVHFFYKPASGQNRLLASIHSGGQNLGNVTITSYVDGTPALVPACDNPTNPFYKTSVMERHWVVTPQFQPTTPIRVSLPFKDTELTNLVTVSNLNQNQVDNVSGLGDLQLSKYSGPLNVDNSPYNNCVDLGGSGGTTTGYSSPASGNSNAYSVSPSISIPTSKYKVFTIPSFSELWLHGTSNSSPLHVELVAFSGSCIHSVIRLNWVTASESNSMYFIIEKSRDLEHWNELELVNAAGFSSEIIHYSISDHNFLDQITYYRIIEVDKNGVKKIMSPISISCKMNENQLFVYPNPSDGVLNLEIISSLDVQEAQIQLIDLTGKIVFKRAITVLEGGNNFCFGQLDLAKGNYIVQIVNDQINFENQFFIVK